MIKQIAAMLALELKASFPLHELHLAPYMDGASMSTTSGEPQIAGYSISAIKDGIGLFSIHISNSLLSLTINKDSPKFERHTDIKGLPGVALGVMISNDNDTIRYDLADPNSLDALLGRLREEYNSSSECIVKELTVSPELAKLHKELKDGNSDRADRADRADQSERSDPERPRVDVTIRPI